MSKQIMNKKETPKEVKAFIVAPTVFKAIVDPLAHSFGADVPYGVL